MIESKKDSIDVDYIAKMQGDNKDFNASNILPFLMKIDLPNAHLKSARNIFTGWDYQLSMDSNAAALFEVFWKNLLRDTFYDEIPEKLHPGGGSRWVEVVRDLLQKPDDPWWDNQKTSTVEHRDDILRAAFSDAVDELDRMQGNDPAKWKWGTLHTLTFHNGSFGQSGINLLERLFNRGPYFTGGGSITVNATSWTASESYEVSSVPSMRMIVDLSDLNHSRAIHTTGQSGHPFQAHYIDMAESWRKIEYHPMLWDRSSVEANSESRMRLIPR
jgi:penicillin amidase